MSVVATLATAGIVDGANPVTLTLKARSIEPGEVVRVDVELAAPADDVRVTAAGRTIACLHESKPFSRCLALVGIDLGAEPGDGRLVVEARLGGEVTAREELAFDIGAKSFPTRKLRVPPRFVDPPRSALARIEREREAVAAVFNAASPEPMWRGKFDLPVSSRVVSAFGVRSVFNGQPRNPHNGVDISAPTGTPIEAPNAGRVVLATEQYFSGNTVIIDHGGEVFSFLAHLSRIDVTVGQRVSRGDVVGLVGATGRVTGPHLHWTMRVSGARVDPTSLVAALESVADLPPSGR